MVDLKVQSTQYQHWLAIRCEVSAERDTVPTHTLIHDEEARVMVDSDGRVVIVDMASLSERESDGAAAEVVAESNKRRTPSKSNGNLSNSESR